jgi:hypothetical protein
MSKRRKRKTADVVLCDARQANYRVRSLLFAVVKLHQSGDDPDNAISDLLSMAEEQAALTTGLVDELEAYTRPAPAPAPAPPGAKVVPIRPVLPAA